MNLIRLVLFASLGWILWRLVKKVGVEQEIPPSPVKQGGKMVRCAYCGLHFPEKEAIYEENVIFCCEEHKMVNYSPKTH
jgi:uncharacterized protein